MTSPALVVLVPGRLETRTGGYEYDRRIVTGLRARGWMVDVRELDASFPHPTPGALDHAARTLAGIADDALVLIDGLALSGMPREVEREQRRLRIVALVHSLVSAAVGLEESDAPRLAIGEHDALAVASSVIVTGTAIVPALVQLGVKREQIVIVEPGTDPAPLATGSAPRGLPLELLCVATVNAGKGHEILIQALAATVERDWHLTCVGSLDRDPETVDRVRAMAHAAGLEQRVSLTGELAGVELDQCWDRADVFVLATLSETYGMAVAEALAHGIPIVSTRTGAIPELVGSSAGLLVPPGDASAFAAAIARVIVDAHLRARLAAGARVARGQLPTWDDAVDKMATALSVRTHG